jgi:MSHA biogenesis protein MshO
MNLQRGATLIELVITLLVTGIVAGVAVPLIEQPIRAYDQLSRRAQLVDTADAALSRIASEVHAALPNSLRVGCSGQCIDWLQSVGGGRYRAAGPGDWLDFDPASGDDRFEILGTLPDASDLRFGNDAGDCAANRADCLVIYNTGQPGGDAWAGDNRATLRSLTSGSGVLRFHHPAAGAFPNSSLDQRFYLVRSPLAFLCANGQLRRYSGQPITSTHSAVDSDAELMTFATTRRALLANGVSNCEFRYSPGAASRSGLLTLRLELADDSERITLLVQAQVANTP